MGTVSTSARFSDLGISPQLLKRYTLNGWVSPLGKGAYIKTGDTVNWTGGLYALQEQLKAPVHAGAMTALSMQGMAHYVRIGAEKAYLFAPPKAKLPVWFKNHDWGVKIEFTATSLLPENLGFLNFEDKNYTISISSPERAFLECLHLAPEKFDLIECYQVIEGLTTLRPKLLQSLLEQCGSIKVTRLFLYMATKAGHDWYKHLDQSKFDLGKGSRTITQGGVYVSEFQIIVPKELVKL
jgi:hypothetical protein